MKKRLALTIMGIASVALIIGTLVLTLGAAPGQKTREEIHRVAQDYYQFLSDFFIWPVEYRHLRKLPEDVKKRIAERNGKRERELAAGKAVPPNAKGNEPFTESEEVDGIQGIGSGAKVLSIENLRPIGYNKMRGDVIFWEWMQFARFVGIRLLRFRKTGELSLSAKCHLRKKMENGRSWRDYPQRRSTT